MTMGQVEEKQDHDEHSKAFRIGKRSLVFLVNNWLVIGFGVAAALGYLFPRTSMMPAPFRETRQLKALVYRCSSARGHYKIRIFDPLWSDWPHISHQWGPAESREVTGTCKELAASHNRTRGESAPHTGHTTQSVHRPPLMRGTWTGS